MGITQHKKHLLFVDKRISVDYIRSVVDHFISHDCEVRHLSDTKLPILTKNKKADHVRIDLASETHSKKNVLIVTPEAALGNSSDGGNTNAQEKKQCFSPSKLAEYENEVDKISIEPIEATICCYTEKWIERLSFAEIIHLLNSHSGIIHKGGLSQQWNQRSFMAFISPGIEESLGNGSSYLLMKTLHHIYKIDEDIIWRDPQVFEEKLKRMFGNTANNILNAISRRLTEKISFNNDYAHMYEHWAVA